MNDEQRSLWATHLHGRETLGGWLVLEADPPLWLAKAGEHAGPELEFWLPGSGFTKGVLLFAGECAPIQAGEGYKKEEIEIVEGLAVARIKDAHGDWFAQWCDPEVPMRVHVYSGKDEEFVDAVVVDMEIRARPTT